jgi:hypothetical protein
LTIFGRIFGAYFIGKYADKFGFFKSGFPSWNGLSTSWLIQTNTEQLSIGVRYVHVINAGFDSYFSGNIYSTRIYSRGLTSTEIQQNYNALKNRFGL